ncbi:hypothetical protein TIFTF001_009043 [Ficus carica]|uniref:Protein KAKU4 n=1 Tax=Ficus carica TaxID=3494 RepID=A0AA87ZMF9_FICCA|nr:hypothetical protein TIFTF001_009043 [Ficus carica]
MLCVFGFGWLIFEAETGKTGRLVVVDSETVSFKNRLASYRSGGWVPRGVMQCAILTVPASPRSGGKIVRARRTAGGPRTPYDRPRLANPEPESPNWISKLIFSPTRAIANGAGKLISSVFSQDDSSSSSSSSSSSGSDSSSEENVDNNYGDDDDDISSHGADILKESSGKSEIIKGFRKDAEPMIGQRDSMCAIEELLMQETFTREEGNRLVNIIKARVLEGFSSKGAESRGLAGIPKETTGDEEDLRCTAIMEAKKWLSAKKLKSASKPDVGDVVDDEAVSPVDMAKLYMRTRPQWASPTFKHAEFISQSPTHTHLFKEETPFSIGGSALSASKAKRDTPTTGSWNIQEEIQKVRVKATEEMLRNLPSKKLDWSSRASPISLLAKNIDANVVEKVDASTRLVDDALLTGIFGTRRLQGMFLFWFESEIKKNGIVENLRYGIFISASSGMEITPDGLQNEGPSINRVDIISEQNQDMEVTDVVDGKGGTMDDLGDRVCDEQRLQSSQDVEIRTIPLSDSGVDVVSNHNDASATEKQLRPIAEGSIQGKSLEFWLLYPKSLESNCTTTEGAGNESIYESNGLPPGNGLSTEAVTEQDAMPDGEEHDLVNSSYEKIADGVFEDESCELLSEASVEVPYDYITNGSPNVAQRYSTRQGLKRGLAPNATGDVEKQHGKRPARYNRRKQGISTQ